MGTSLQLFSTSRGLIKKMKSNFLLRQIMIGQGGMVLERDRHTGKSPTEASSSVECYPMLVLRKMHWNTKFGSLFDKFENHRLIIFVCKHCPGPCLPYFF